MALIMISVVTEYCCVSKLLTLEEDNVVLRYVRTRSVLLKKPFTGYM